MIHGLEIDKTNQNESLFRCFRSVYVKSKPTHIAIFRGTYGPGGSTC